MLVRKQRLLGKTSKEAVAKITKKKTKGKKASATIQGVKEGKAKITAVYKLGKTKKKLKCKVTVTKADAAQPTQGVVSPATPTATSGGSGNQATEAPVVSSTPRATRTPAPSPTPSPTPLPNQKYDFEEVKDGEVIPMSDYNGSGKFDPATGRLEINDREGTASQGSWPLPKDIADSIKVGDIVTFRVQGHYYGTKSFRFWIGSDIHGSVTPVVITNEVAEGQGIDPKLGYPCAKDKDGKVLEGMTGEEVQDEVNKNGGSYANQMPITIVDPETKAFDVTFKFKAGTSQDDTKGVFSHFTIKCIQGDYIDGLVINNIYCINGNGPDASASPDTSAEPKPNEVDFSAEQPYKNKDGDVTAEYSGGTYNITIPQFKGIGFEAPADMTCKYIEITYTSDSDLNTTLFDAGYQGSTDRGKPGEHSSDQKEETPVLKKAETETTLKIEAGENYQGNCIKAIKIAHIDFDNAAPKTIKIKSIKFFEAAPDA